MRRSGVFSGEREQVGWYEEGLSSVERKKRGHYSTPLPLVEQILDACGYTADADLSRLRVLDPACGSGNFLAAAARRLLSSTKRLKLSQAEQVRCLARNIWGFDPDPVACLLASMQISVVGTRFIASSSPIDTTLPGRDESRPYDGNVHIHQADSLILPWEPCVDVFLANPPYLAAKNADLSGYRSALQRGQADSYLLFLSLAMQVVRPGGWIGLVLPDPVLARLNASRERAQLLRHLTLHNIWHLADVFAAEVGAVVLVAQNLPPAKIHQVAWVRARWHPSLLLLPSQMTSSPQPSPSTMPLETRHVAQELLQQQPASELRYLLSSDSGALLDQLRATLEDCGNGKHRLAPLGDFVTISRGEELGRQSPFIGRCVDAPVRAGVDVGGGGDACVALGPYKSLPPDVAAHGGDACVALGPEFYEFSPADVAAAGGGGYARPYSRLPVLRGGVDMRPYAAPQSGWRIDREAVTKPMERYLAPKLLVVKSTHRLQAMLDRRGHVALQTLYLLHARGHAGEREQIDTLYFFLALLNSQLLRDYVYVLHTAYKWVQPQIEQRVLAALPVPLVGREGRAEIIGQAKRLEGACSSTGAVVEWNEEINTLYEALERSIRALYMVACNT